MRDTVKKFSEDNKAKEQLGRNNGSATPSPSPSLHHKGIKITKYKLYLALTVFKIV